MLLLGSPYDAALDAQTAFIKRVVVTATRGSVSASFEAESGSLTQDARRSMRWNGTLAIPIDTDFPTVPGDLLTPFGTTITVRLGLYLVSGAFADVPYGVYRLQRSFTELAPASRMVNLTLVDQADALAAYRFESPFEVPSGTDLADAINMVVLDRLGTDPELDPTGDITARARIFGLDPELDPWRELEDLAAGFGYRIYYNRDGVLILDQPPIPDPSAALPLGGELTVAGVFDHQPPNVVVVRGETSTTTTPVQSIAMDEDITSPTYAGTLPGSSAYGRVTYFYTSPLITTQGQADLAAQNILAREAGAAATWSVGKAYEPTTDPDDIFTVALDASTNLPLVVDAVTVSIEGSTTMECRAVSQLSE